MDIHKKAVEVLVTLPETTRDVEEVLSSAHADEKAVNRQCLVTEAENIRFLAGQGIASPIPGNFLYIFFFYRGRTGSFSNATTLQCLVKQKPFVLCYDMWTLTSKEDSTNSVAASLNIGYHAWVVFYPL